VNREAMLARVAARREPWDILVVGGGATGLGAAVDAASRGYATLLVEQSDFAKGTSSRSTKLIHGGVRYLQQGNVALVLESLHERGVLMANAPHLVRNLSFVVPNYDWWEGPFYGIGLKLYDMLAGDLGLGPSRHLSRAQTLERIPTLEQKGLRGGVIYHDGQFDDARLAITLMQTLEDLGGSAVNYLQVTGLLRDKNLVAGVTARDLDPAGATAGGGSSGGGGAEHRIAARAVINATGVWCDALRTMDDPRAQPVVTASQGAHIVLDRAFQPGTSAIMVPHTDDGRVLFAVPWHGRVVVGTTETPLEGAPLEPRPLGEEIDFLLGHAARYLARDPRPSDILSCFAGIRPLVKGEAASTASLSRDHAVLVSTSGLVSITGGKWTTYRRMGRDVVNSAAAVAGLPEKASRTETLRLHGFVAGPAAAGRAKASRASSHGAGSAPPPWDVYGADAPEIRRLAKEEPALVQRLHPRLPYRGAHVVWAARREMARTVEDVLARRTRALLLDARASVQAAPRVAELLARELGRDAAWRDAQVEAYVELARGYLPA
jgi:glycerol-3-phosphate dehydrogenase